MTTRADNISANLTHDLRSLMELMQAHDAVHPGRNECGGVGGCVTLSTETDAMQELEESIERLAPEGWRLAVTAIREEG